MPRRSAAAAPHRSEKLTEDAAWGRLLNWFGLRPRTEWETSQRLSVWDVDADMAGRLTERLRQDGLLDDHAFARAYAAELARKGMRGPAVRTRLTARGVPQPIAALMTAEVEPDDPRRAALAVAMRRAQYLPADEDTAVRRLASFLMRRGVGGQTALDVAREAVSSRKT